MRVHFACNDVYLRGSVSHAVTVKTHKGAGNSFDQQHGSTETVNISMDSAAALQPLRLIAANYDATQKVFDASSVDCNTESTSLS